MSLIKNYNNLFEKKDPHRTENEDRGTRKHKMDILVNVGKWFITMITELP
jgi:hypothetical protein